MARDEEIERRLQNWARWKLSCTGGPLGFAGVDLESAGIHRDPYASAPVPTLDVEAAETEEALKQLPADLWETVVLFYVGAGSQAKKAKKLGITERGMRGRIEQAHRWLSAYFTGLNERRRAERTRVEGLLRGVFPGS